jgi:hypothetical protein
MPATLTPPTAIRFSLALALPLVHAGCGHDHGNVATADAASLADAGPPDAWAPDAPPGPAPVTVWVHDGLVGLAGRRVLFLGPDDEVISEQLTDGAGEATATVPFGGQALMVSPDGNYVILWQGLSVGTLEVFVDGTYAPLTVIAPSRKEPNGLYQVQTPCGGGGGPASTLALTFYRQGCTVGDAIVTWRNGAAPSQALLVTNRDITGGGTLDLSAEAYSPMVERSITFANLPSAPQTIVSFAAAYAGFHAPGVANNVGSARGDQVLAGWLPDTPTASLYASVGQLEAGSAREVLWRGAYDATSFDPTGGWLPHLGPATYDAADRRLSWSETGGDGAHANALRAGIAFDLPGDPNVGTDVYWDIVAPPGTAVHVPTLPASYADIDPAGATTTQPARVEAILAPDGFAAYRDRVFSRAGWYLLDRDGTASRSINRPFL